MRFAASLTIAMLLALLTACGSQPPSGAAAPTSSAPASAPTSAAAPTQAPEATAAPALTQLPEPTSAPAATDTPAPTDEPPTAVPASPTTKPAAPTAAPAPQPASQSKEALVIIRRSGGIAGITEEMTVYGDGRLEFGGDVVQTQAQAAPNELTTLQQLLASPEFAALNTRYSAIGADMFVYEISVPGSGKKVVTTDGAKNPPVLEQVLAELQQLLKRAR